MCSWHRAREESWIDFDLYGHQVVAHVAPEETGNDTFSGVDEQAVPVKHFGGAAVGRMARASRYLRAADVAFHQAVHPFCGRGGEQTMLFPDPSGTF